MSVLSLSLEILNSGFANSTLVTTKVIISLPDSNYTFKMQEIQHSFAYFDREKPTQTAIPNAEMNNYNGTFLSVTLKNSVIPARAVARYVLNLERGKKGNTASDFPPVLMVYQVITLLGDSIATPELRLAETYAEINYTLRSFVPITVLPPPGNSTDESNKQYSAVVIGLSVAGGLFLLGTILVAVFFLVRWLLNRKKQAQSPIPAFEEAPKALEAGTIDLEMDQTPNQL
jgi:hypothetical protein